MTATADSETYACSIFDQTLAGHLLFRYDEACLCLCLQDTVLNNRMMSLQERHTPATACWLAFACGMMWLQALEHTERIPTPQTPQLYAKY
jgi:hypothetical protein